MNNMNLVVYTAPNVSLIPYMDPESSNNQVTLEYTAGLLQADGSFLISVSKTSSGAKWNTNLTPTCSIELDGRPELKAKEVLTQINALFDNTGSLYYNAKKNTYLLSFGKKGIQVILPILSTHPLFLGNKANAMSICQLVLTLLGNKAHHDPAIMAELFATIYQSNPDSTQRTPNVYLNWFSRLPDPDVIYSARALPYRYLYRTDILTDDFLIGFIEGDGGFTISFKENRVVCLFGLRQAYTPDNLELLNRCNEYLGNPGVVRTVEKDGRSHYLWSIEGVNKQIETLVPFILRNYDLLHIKRHTFGPYLAILRMLDGNPRLSKSQMLLAIELAYNINRDGKRRKYTKEEYIERYNLMS